MVVFFLRNSQAPDAKVVPITVALKLDSEVSEAASVRPDQNTLGTGKDFPNLLDQEGNSIWLMMVAPPRNELDKDTGFPIPPEFINLISKKDFHTELEAAMGRIGSRIDWPFLIPDTSPPKLFSIEPPLDKTDNVNILSNIIIRIKDSLPSSGLDLSTLNMKINDLPVVTSGIAEVGEVVELRGNPFDLTLIHRPKRITS